jgi:hypothetical protein
MSKDMFIAAHEELIEQYLIDHPDCDWSEAYERTADFIDARYSSNVADKIDAARQRAKDGALQ